MKNSIGGFPGLDFTWPKLESREHSIWLTAGRSCLRSVLEETQPSKLYLPFYVCASILEPARILGTAIEFYSIDQSLDPVGLPERLQKNEIILYVNYFGLKRATALSLAEKFRQQLIIDNVHDFYWESPPCSWSYNSARKFFGVPDGALLSGPREISYPASRNNLVSATHLRLRSDGLLNEAYSAFVSAEQSFTSEVLRISELSELMLGHIDFQSAFERRQKNYLIYVRELQKFNLLSVALPGDVKSLSPLAYPFLPQFFVNRKLLHAQKVFVPQYWKEVGSEQIAGEFEFERRLSEALLPLPVHHSLDESDCLLVCKKLLGLLKES